MKEAARLYKKIEELYHSPEVPPKKFLELFEFLESLEPLFEGLERELQERARAEHCLQRLKKYGDIDEACVTGMLALVIRTIQRLFSTPPPESLSEIATRCFPLSKKSSEKHRDFPNFLVLRIPRQNERTIILQGSHGEDGFLALYLSKHFERLVGHLTPGERLTILQVKKGEGDNIYFDTPQTQVILKPYMLLEVSALGECQARELTHIPEVFFLRNMLPQATSENALYGKMLTVLFAMHLEEKDALFPQLVERFLEENPRDVLLLQSMHPHSPLTAEEIVRRLGPLYERLAKSLGFFDEHHLIPEVLLLSEKIGLIGRLDFLATTQNRWHIIEVKTGKAPKKNRLPWSSHWMQLTGYLHITHTLGFPLHEISYLLYPGSETAENALRPLPYDQNRVRTLIALRNRVIQLHQRLQKNPEETLTEMLHPESKLPDKLPAYLRNDFQSLQRVFNEATPLQRKYYTQFLRFLLNEQEYERVGTSWAPRCFSLWRRTPEEKQQTFSILWDLTWDQKASNPCKGLFTFRFPQTDTYSDFRTGDPVLLLPKAVENINTPFFLSGFIATIDASNVEIQTRFKQAFLYYLQNHPHCRLNMEHSFYDQYPYLIRSLSRFLFVPPEKRDLLLGLRKPSFANTQIPLPRNLREEQKECLLRAFQAEDYFLLQGPPGTGKTRVFLANLVKLLLTHTSENLLILAFTNRAVDEACSAIKKTLPDTPFLRLGSDVNTEHTDCSLRALLSNQKPQETLRNASRIRVVVSTVSSCLTQWDLIQLFHPTVAIVDEASQLLEPHLVGILSMMKRFILIGDEKQLPAVVVQPEHHLIVEDPELHTIGLFHLGVSLFERLLHNAENRKWHECHGMLKAQGRMHRIIQNAANLLFYENKLCILHEEKQSRPIEEYDPKSKDPFEKALASSRLIFVPTHREVQPRVHEEEVELVLRFLEILERVHKNHKTVGVITPFRAQVNAIRKALKKEWHAWVQVDTVERFQGSEKDVIIISTAVSSEKQLPLIQSLPPRPLRKGKTPLDRKLNVAITRAREHLVLLGVPELLRRVPQYEALLNYIEKWGIHFTYSRNG